MMKLYMGTRQPAASSSTDPASNLVKDDFPEALTYRFNDNSAWVPAARTHDEAVDLAKHAYPELRSVRRDRITFHTTGKSSIACITPAAWQLVVRRLPPYHVVDVRIRDVEGLDDDCDLPEYPYMATSIVMREKEEQNLRKEEPRATTGSQVEGNRLSRMMSFIRGVDS